jgi:hypothetical protein
MSLFGNVQLPEVQTDVEMSLNNVIRANGLRLGLGLFVVIVVAIVIANGISNRFFK